MTTNNENKKEFLTLENVKDGKSANPLYDFSGLSETERKNINTKMFEKLRNSIERAKTRSNGVGVPTDTEIYLIDNRIYLRFFATYKDDKLDGVNCFQAINTNVGFLPATVINSITKEYAKKQINKQKEEEESAQKGEKVLKPLNLTTELTNSELDKLGENPNYLKVRTVGIGEQTELNELVGENNSFKVIGVLNHSIYTRSTGVEFKRNEYLTVKE